MLQTVDTPNRQDRAEGGTLSAQAFDESLARTLVSLGQEEFGALYSATHSEAAETLYQVRQESGNEEQAIPGFIRREFDDQNKSLADDMERMSPGEFMAIYSPLHSAEAEKLYALYNRDALVFSNDPSINDYGTERLQQIFAQAADDPYDDEFGLTDDEKKKKEELRRSAEFFDRTQDAREERMEQHRMQWDKAMHRIGNREYSGADIHNMWEYLHDEDGAAEFEDSLVQKEGITKEEAKRRRLNLQEYLDLQEKQRNGEKLTEQEEYDIAHPSKEVERDSAFLEQRLQLNQLDKRANDTNNEKQIVSTNKRLEMLSDFTDNSASITNPASPVKLSATTLDQKKTPLTESYNETAAATAKQVSDQKADTSIVVGTAQKAATVQVAGLGF